MNTEPPAPLPRLTKAGLLAANLILLSSLGFGACLIVQHA